MAFSITEDQYQRLLSRVTKLETTMNDLIVAFDNVVTRLQVDQLLTVLQTENQDLRETVEALEARVTSIEEEPLT